MLPPGSLVIVVADASVVTIPPVWTASDLCPTAKPIAVVTIGRIAGTIHPDPGTIPPYPMTFEVVPVVIAVL
jgi:hypothetical protein